MGAPAVGDLVLFEHPLHPGEMLVRRVIATEGQAVEISGKAVYVNGEPFKETSEVQHSDYRILPRDFSNRDYTNPEKVPPGHVYVLGDNRDQAEDSRNFGFVAKNTIEGKGLFIYFSWTPDPKAPKMRPPYIIPALQILFYNIGTFPSRVRWDRLFSTF
jgi:signal peptidase I